MCSAIHSGVEDVVTVFVWKLRSLFNPWTWRTGRVVQHHMVVFGVSRMETEFVNVNLFVQLNTESDLSHKVYQWRKAHCNESKVVAWGKLPPLNRIYIGRTRIQSKRGNIEFDYVCKFFMIEVPREFWLHNLKCRRIIWKILGTVLLDWGGSWKIRKSMSSSKIRITAIA
jgi:hypothetical protein